MSQDEPSKPYLGISREVEHLFRQYGDTHKGLGYPRNDGFEIRQRVLLEVMRFGSPKPRRPFVLDIGCASGLLLDAWAAARFGPKDYLGVDLSEMMIATAREKHPREWFLVADPLISDEVWRRAPDYVVMGGIFTWRPSVSREAMLAYFLALVRKAFDNCKIGVSFNLISKHVDWERDDLFHMPFDELAALLRTQLSANYVFRADYGLREFTTYVYK